MKLTQKTVAALTLPKGASEKIWFDDDLAGFGIRLRDGGSRRFIFQYKLGTKQRRVAVGAFPAITVENARQTAGQLHAQVRLGYDPAGEKTERRTRAAETMGAVLPAYLARKAEGNKPRTYREIERHLNKHSKALHGMQLAAIDRRAVAARLTAIAESSGPSAANRVRASLAAFFAWSVTQGLVDTNPVTGTNVEAEAGARDRILADDELRDIWRAAGDDQHGSIIKLLMLTMQRRDEIADLARSETDCDAATITLPPARTKNRRQHVVPLSAPALAIIAAQPLRTNKDGMPRDLLFGFGNGGFSDWSHSKHKIDARINEGRSEPLPRWTLHDLRRTAATRAADLGTQPHILEAVLNHISGHKAGVHGIYNRSTYEPEKRKALDLWASYLINIVERGTSNIVPLRPSVS
jgi:integrase